MTISEKTAAFIAEIGKRELTAEQKRIYNAFVFRRAKPYHFVVNDAYGNTIRFSLYTNKKDDGVLHILGKHYKGVGDVTAFEILNLCEIIRRGNVTIKNSIIVYQLSKKGKIYKLIVALKPTRTGENILKSFYSNKKIKEQPVARC